MKTTGNLLALTLLTVMSAQSVMAETEQAIEFQIPAQNLSSALLQFSENSGVKTFFKADIARNIKSEGLSGKYTPEQALDKLLENTGVDYRFTETESVTLSSDRSEMTTEMLLAMAPGEMVVADASSDDEYTGPVEQEDLTVSGRELSGYSVINASTATKTDTPLFDTPVSIQVVPKSVMQDQQAFRMADVLQNVSGVQQSIRETYDIFIVRGFGLGNSHYRNGTRIPKVIADLANVEQVEVLKGPASILFGRVEPGGLVNTITKSPTDEPTYSIEQRFGSYDYYRTEVSASGPITDDKSLLYRADLSYLSTNSFRDINFNDRVFFAPAVSWRPSEDTEFNLSLEYLDEDKNHDSGLPAVGNTIVDVPISRNTSQDGLEENFNHVLVEFDWSHNINENWKVRNGTTSLFFEESWEELYGWSLQNDNQTLSRGAWFGGGDTEVHTVFLDLTGKFETFGVEHSVLFGADYYDEHILRGAIDEGIPSVNIFNPVSTVDISSFTSRSYPISLFEDQQGGWFEEIENTWYGVYFQDQMSFLDGKVKILGGGRYDWANTKTGSAYYSPVSKSDKSDENFSPRVGLVFQPWDWVSLYGNFVESFGANNGSSKAGDSFDPQEATQYEAGFKTEFFDGRLNSTLAFYHLTKNNILTSDPSNPNFDKAIGEARSQGMEFDLNGQLTDGLSVIASYAYTDTKVTKDNDGAEGNRLAHVPLHSGSVWMKYAFQDPLLQGGSLGSGVFMAGERYGDASNSFKDGGYARWDMFASYKHKINAKQSLTAQVNVNNITSTKYFTTGSRKRNFPGAPLTVFGSLKFEF